MIAKINRRGSSFKGIAAYVMHDKGASTSERVVWSETGNLRTGDIEKAALVMAWTDTNREGLRAAYREDHPEAGGSAAGRKGSAGNVYHFSLSWAIGEDPDEAHQRQTARNTIDRQGLGSHQYFIVAHDDTEHKHVHVVANLVHPETGKIHDPGLDKRRLQKWALEYEREHGLHCHMREENARKHECGDLAKYRTEKQDYSIRVTRAYEASDNGASFVNSLEAEGLKLAAARRGNGFVLVDEKGDIQKLARQLDIEEKGKAKTAAINAKLADLDRAALPDADALKRDIQARKARDEQYEKDGIFDREQAEREAQEKIENAAIEQAKKEDLVQKKQAKKPHIRSQELAKRQREQEITEKYARIQKRIDEKTAEGRKTWQIDELTQAKKNAQAEFDRHNTLFKQLFMRGAYLDTKDHLEDITQRLEERRQRFRDDIEAFNKNRPDWLKKRELEKHGFGKDEDQQQGGIDGRRKPDNIALREAESSPEAAERLAENLTGKTHQEKAKISRIKEKARDYRQKRAAEKTVQQSFNQANDNNPDRQETDNGRVAAFGKLMVEKRKSWDRTRVDADTSDVDAFAERMRDRTPDGPGRDR